MQKGQEVCEIDGRETEGQGIDKKIKRKRQKETYRETGTKTVSGIEKGNENDQKNRTLISVLQHDCRSVKVKPKQLFQASSS